MKQQILLYLCILATLIAQIYGQRGESSNKSASQQLKQFEIKNLKDLNTYLLNKLVIFQSYDCIECNMASAELLKLDLMTDKNPEIIKLQCEKHEQICKVFEITKTPRMIYFSKDQKAYEYKGQINAIKIYHEFLQNDQFQKVNGALLIKDLQSYLTQNLNRVFGFTKNLSSFEQMQSLFGQIFDQPILYLFYKIGLDGWQRGAKQSIFLIIIAGPFISAFLTSLQKLMRRSQQQPKIKTQ